MSFQKFYLYQFFLQIFKTKIWIISTLILLNSKALSQSVLINGYYLDIAERKVIPFSSILITNGVIGDIDNKELTTLNYEKMNLSVIDLEGGYLLPGLVDSFSHSLPTEPSYLSRTGVVAASILGGINPGMGQLPFNYTYFHFPTIPDDVQGGTLLYSGPRIIYKARKRNMENVVVQQVRERSSDFEVETMEDLEDLLKNWEENPPSFIYVDMLDFPILLLQSLFNEAKERQLKIIAYAETVIEAIQACEQGSDLVVMNWGSDFEEKEIEALAKKNIPLITSVSVYRKYGKALRQEQEGEKWYQKAKENLKKFLNSGGKSLIGNFYGAPWVTPGPPLDEISVYKELGISDGDILETLTLSPLEAMGYNPSLNNRLTQKLGKIATGYAGDLIITSQNPMKNIYALANINKVINNGHLIRGNNEAPHKVEIDLAYIKYFTRKNMLVRSWIPLVDNPRITHLTFAPLIGGVEMEDGEGYFEFGLFTRFLIPSIWEYHQLEIDLGAVFYDTTLFHTSVDYLHFFTPRWGIGFATSILPDYHYIAGIHIQHQRNSYFAPGSKEWFALDLYINFEEYVVEKASLLAVRIENNFDFYDYLPTVFNSLNFILGLEGAIQLNEQKKYLEQFFMFNIGIGFWQNTLWQKNLWGQPLTRFRYQENDGYFKTMRSLFSPRKYNEKDYQNTMIGWTTEIDVPLFSWRFINFTTSFFWEMQKRDSSFSRLFHWDDQWVMDFGFNLAISLGTLRIILGLFTPINHQGKVMTPGFYGDLFFFLKR